MTYGKVASYLQHASGFLHSYSPVVLTSLDIMFAAEYVGEG